MSHSLPMRITAIVSSKGQVVIPKTLREKLGIHAGSELLFKIRAHGIIEMRQQQRSIDAFFGCCKHDSEKAMSIQDMDAAIMQAVDEQG